MPVALQIRSADQLAPSGGTKDLTPDMYLIVPGKDHDVFKVAEGEN
jgi:hypothetical protein